MKDGLREGKYRCIDFDKELTPDERFCCGKLKKPPLTEQDKEFQVLIEVAEEYLKQKRPARAPATFTFCPVYANLLISKNFQSSGQAHLKEEM